MQFWRQWLRRDCHCRDQGKHGSTLRALRIHCELYWAGSKLYGLCSHISIPFLKTDKADKSPAAMAKRRRSNADSARNHVCRRTSLDFDAGPIFERPRDTENQVEQLSKIRSQIPARNGYARPQVRDPVGFGLHLHLHQFLGACPKDGLRMWKKKKKRIPTKPTYAVCGSEVIWQVVCVAAVMTIGVSHKAAAKMNKCSRDPAGVKRTAESCPWPAKSGTGTEPDLDFRLPIRLLFREAILNICQIGLVVNHGSLGRE